jgi:hypothetical protein
VADNTTLNAGTGGDVVASDDIGPGVKYQRVKVTLGADGVNDGDVASGNPMPVNVSSALPAGTNNIGDVDVLSLPSLAAGTNNIGDVDVLTVNGVAPAFGSGVRGATVQRVTIATDDSVPVTGTFWQATQPVSGTVTANLAAGTNNIGDVDVLTVNGVAPAFGTGVRDATVQRVTIATDDVVPVSDNGGSLTIDGTVTANLAAGTNNIGDVDVLTVPAPLSTTGGGTEAAALRVTIANDSTGVVSVDDNGGSLTVDGTVALAAGTANIGDVDVLTVPAPLSTTGNGTAATALRVTIASDTTGLLDIEGDLAHDAPDSTSKPVKIGAKAIAHGANPTAVAAADRTDLYANRHGVLWTLGGHPNIITRSVRIADADGAQTDASIVGTINAGTKVAVTMLTVTCDAANTNATAVKVGFGATNIPGDSATGANGVLLDHEGIAAGSGIVIGSGAGLIGIGADGEELRLTCEDPVGGFVIVTFSYFTIES